VHRIGRTGRAGREGDAITLVAPREQRQLRLIERLIGKRLQRLRLPSPADVAARRREAVMEQIRAAIDEGALEPYLSMVEALGDDYDPVEIAAAALKVLGDGTLVRAEPAAASGDGAGVEPGMERLFIHAGRRAGIRPMDIVGAIANEAGLPGNRVGAIDLYDNFAFVEVPKEDVGRVLAALNHTTLRGQRVEVDVAKPKK
jgi:ATP-dependent RNA helicase DeaD